MLIIPILDDELLDGYIGRLLILNGKQSKSQFRNYLLACYRTNKRSEESLLSLLSNIGCLNRKNSMEVLLDHTLLPVYNAMTDMDVISNYINMDILQWMNMRRRFSACQVLRVCTDCVAHDLHEHGASFWHRSHQLPGRIFCTTHHSCLSWLPDRQSIYFQPEHVLHQAIPLALENMGTSPYLIKQIEAIFDAILYQKIKFPSGGVESILEREMTRKWPGHTKHKKVRYLKEHLESIYGVPWLKFLMPNRVVESKSGMTSFSKLSLLNCTSLSIELAVVSLFAVFTSAQEVFDEFQNSIVKPDLDMDLPVALA